MRPIYLKLSKPADKLSTGSSRFWGNPDLPAGTGYPTYTADDGEKYHYEFICQINLSDVASLDRDGLLPRKGLLSFFAKIGYYMGDMDNVPGIGGYVSDAGDVSVLYFPEVDDTFHEAVLVDEDGRQVNPDELRIDFAHGASHTTANMPCLRHPSTANGKHGVRHTRIGKYYYRLIRTRAMISVLISWIGAYSIS